MGASRSEFVVIGFQRTGLAQLFGKTPRAHGRPLLLRGAHITLWVYIYAGYPARVVKDDGKGDRNLFSGLTNRRFEYPVAERMSLGFALHLYKCSQKGKKLTYFRKYELKYPDYRRIFLKSYAILAVCVWKFNQKIIFEREIPIEFDAKKMLHEKIRKSKWKNAMWKQQKKLPVFCHAPPLLELRCDFVQEFWPFFFDKTIL